MALVCGVLTHLRAAPEIADGPYKADRESLRQYQCPEWFRDAKFGIWSHWGPQAVPMEGDWYARNMYIPGQRQYKHHLEAYGHPSTNGWKDIIPLWKAEKFDPDRLMKVYKKAGARYFVSMGVHHDNFDLWNSKYQRWNAVNMGPHRDIVGAWQKAAKKNGLPFGVSEHLGASFWWWQVNKKSDPEGDLKGVPYDGAGSEWQDLYHWKASPDDTKNWYSGDPRWHALWFNRIRDLVDNYKPDLLYTDGGVPFGNETGLGLIAHLYNSDPRRKKAAAQVVYTCKQKSEGSWVEDLERGVMPGINPHPWQTDTSIGDWFYNRNWKVRPVSWTIHMLVDIVSKNGNLLLNVVQRPDGSLDPQIEKDLEDLAAWMSVNSEGIYATRPWLVHGEGPVRAKGGHFKEDFAYTARDIRFTSKGDNTLYAFSMGWPEDRQLLIRSLAKMDGVQGRIADVKLLGYKGKIAWKHTENGLAVELPSNQPCEHAIALKITGRQLRAFKPELAAPSTSMVDPDASGVITLTPDSAEIHGAGLKSEEKGGESNLGFWDDAADWVSWKANIKHAGRYQLIASCATVHETSEATLEVGDQKLPAKISSTGAWEKFQAVELGTVEIKQTGSTLVSMRPKDAALWKPINLRWVKLKPAP